MQQRPPREERTPRRLMHSLSLSLSLSLSPVLSLSFSLSLSLCLSVSLSLSLSVDRFLDKGMTLFFEEIPKTERW